jgi:predicted enzyme related to lactoylglutathione lyase
MSDAGDREVGIIGWTDLTVGDAEKIKDFYAEVVGWRAAPVDMRGYEDYNMNAPASGVTVAGICHARGLNAQIPPQWLLYINVADIEKSAQRCVELGGTVIVKPRDMGHQGRFCVIQDPAGAVAALFQPARTSGSRA